MERTQSETGISRFIKQTSKACCIFHTNNVHAQITNQLREIHRIYFCTRYPEHLFLFLAMSQSCKHIHVHKHFLFVLKYEPLSLMLICSYALTQISYILLPHQILYATCPRAPSTILKHNQQACCRTGF